MNVSIYTHKGGNLLWDLLFFLVEVQDRLHKLLVLEQSLEQRVEVANFAGKS